MLKTWIVLYLCLCYKCRRLDEWWISILIEWLFGLIHANQNFLKTLKRRYMLLFLKWGLLVISMLFAVNRSSNRWKSFLFFFGYVDGRAGSASFRIIKFILSIHFLFPFFDAIMLTLFSEGLAYMIIIMTDNFT